MHNPVDAKGKIDFGVEPGEVLKLKYVDKDPPHGFTAFKNHIFTCKVCLIIMMTLNCNNIDIIKIYPMGFLCESQVISFSVEKPTRNAKNQVVKGGKIIVSLQWLNGPAKFMRKYASARPIQVYSAEDFIEQFVIVKQQKEA